MASCGSAFSPHLSRGLFAGTWWSCTSITLGRLLCGQKRFIDLSLKYFHVLDSRPKELVES
jgi:hypothetical protein